MMFFKLRQLARCEDGAAYTLSYVMVIPVLVLLTCVIVETTLMMCAKVGTVYAAYSGARTAAVWCSAARDWPTVENRIEQAAIKSFVPFAGGASVRGSSPSEASDYAAAYAAFVGEPVSQPYILAKYRNAANRLMVTTSGAPASHDANMEVTVEYRFRFNIPGIGKLLGEKGDEGYYFPLTSSATLQNEGPGNRTQDLGIGYGRFD